MRAGSLSRRLEPIPCGLTCVCNIVVVLMLGILQLEFVVQQEECFKMKEKVTKVYLYNRLPSDFAS